MEGMLYPAIERPSSSERSHCGKHSLEAKRNGAGIAERKRLQLGMKDELVCRMHLGGGAKKVGIKTTVIIRLSRLEPDFLGS